MTLLAKSACTLKNKKMTETKMETKEVSVVKQQASKALNAATKLVIKTPEDLSKATDHLSKMKTVGKMIKERKEAITKPLNEALAQTRDLFKPIEQNLAEAERIIKNKMLAYQDEQGRNQKEAQAKIVERVEKGTMRADTAVAKLEKLPEVQTTAQGKIGSISTRIVKKYRVVNESLLPREYLTPDMGKITEALKAGLNVPGAEIYEEKVISAK